MGKLTKLPKRKLALNTIYCADNLEVMKQLPGESIDLIYIDPPFCTQSVHRSKAWDDKVQMGQFDDRWGGGLNSYVAWMRPRLAEMHRLLKKSGSLFVHVDYRAVHYLKIELDKIFGGGKIDKGTKHFRNEIIWHYSGWNKFLNGYYERRHDNILFYSKSQNRKEMKWNKIGTPYKNKAEYLKRRKQKLYVDKKGKEYTLDVRNGGKRRTKIYLSDVMSRGQPQSDVWILDKLNNSDKEKANIGYPTQKPLALLRKIIESTTEKGDVVADFFCGCGTAMSAAHGLDRKWIGVDASKTASAVIRKRMKDDHGLKIDVTPLKSLTKSQVLSMHHRDFEKYVVRCVGGIPNEIQVGDGGIDGRLEDGTPIQVKQSEKVGRPAIDSFYQHMQNNGRGLIIAKSFTKTAKDEVARLLNENGWELILMTVDDILREYYNESA